jgi:hypothetical protein
MARNPRSIMLAKRQTRPRKRFNKPAAICSKRIWKAKRPKYVDLSRPTAAQDQLPAQGEHLAALKKLFCRHERRWAFIFPIAGGYILIYS